MLGKFKFYLFFYGLMISEKNINKNKKIDFLRVVVKYIIVKFL